MDVFIGGHAHIHGADHKRNGPYVATMWQLCGDLSSYDILREAATYESPYDLTPQDALVYASVIAHPLEISK